MEDDVFTHVLVDEVSYVVEERQNDKINANSNQVYDKYYSCQMIVLFLANPNVRVVNSYARYCV